MRYFPKILCFLLILVLISISYVNLQDTDSSYLLKYNQLYFSNKFETRKDFIYENTTSEYKCYNDTLDCSDNGICTEDNLDCTCNPGFVTLENSFQRCTYTQKSKSTALLLEAFIGFGMGHLYIGNYTFFIGKFLFYYFSCYFNLCIMVFVGSINDSNVNPDTYSATKRTSYIMFPIMIGWWLFDIIMFFMNKYKDSYSVDLY